MVFSLTFFTTLAAAVAAKECSEHFAEGKIPDTEGTFLCRKKGDKTFFATVYDTKIRCPKFSAYLMKPEEQKHDAYKRKGFTLDPDVPADQQAHSKDKAFDSTHDIGHLAPSNAFTWDQSDDGAWAHTYMMTNVAPQGSYFNEHPWAFVEKHTREFCVNHNVELYVVTGVIQADRPTMVEGDAVPEYYYKALCDMKSGQSVAFLGENTDCKECGITKDGKYILNSVSDVEKKAGYSIFPSSCNPTKVDEAFWDVFHQSSTLATAAATKECSEHFAEGKVPDTEGTFLCRKKGDKTFFATVYDTKIRCPKFSAYLMKPEEQKHDAYKRKGFTLDPDVPADQQAHSKDKAFDSTHDIGHLAPSNAFTWDQSDDGAWAHTYMMTNVAPQGSYFNEHPWAFVEKHTREFCVNHNVELYVVTGVIQADRPTMVEGDAVPEYYYKALCDMKSGQSVAFLGENTDCKECGITKDGKYILNSVSDVEKKAGYSIFPSSCNPTKVDEAFWDVFHQSSAIMI